MITIEQLKDWSQVSVREQLISEIEDVIDNRIKDELMRGNKHVVISTGGTRIDGVPEKSWFHPLWCNENLSKDNLDYVRQTIIEKYQEIGLIVKSVVRDEGQFSSFDALEITIPQELLE